MITINGEKVETFNFSGGEVHPKIPLIYPRDITVKAFIHSANDIMELLLVKNAIDETNFYRAIHLIIPYVPYARQDRVCNEREALSIKVMCDLINSMNFNMVTIYDPHSDVTPALINNCVVISQDQILAHFDDLDMEEMTLVSPDAGAEKKTLKVAAAYGGLKVVNANKQRNTETGEIVGTHVDFGKGIYGEDLLIVDDICDGGRTFIELAKKLVKGNPNSISLYVTHGIFSKGVGVLFDAGISKVYTTNSFEQRQIIGLHVAKL